MGRFLTAALAALIGGSTYAAVPAFAQVDPIAQESLNAVPRNFFGLRWEFDSFNAQNAIMNAGIDLAIKMAKARVAVLDGRLTPVASFSVSPAVTTRVEKTMLESLADPGSNAKMQAAQLAQIRAGYSAYRADAASLGEPPDNFVTACAYYVVSSLEIERDEHLTSAEKRAIRGDCVTVLGARQQGAGLYVSEASRQFVSQALATAAGLAVHAYAAAAPDRQADIKSGVEEGFHQFFGSTLSQIPVDHLACVGARTSADHAQCDRIPNARFAAVADSAN